MARDRLTPAQRDALHVLVKAAEPPGGGRVEASKRSSTLEPRPNVNVRAGTALARFGLARMIDPDVERGYTIPSGVSRGMVCDYKFEVTAAGVAVYGAMDDFDTRLKTWRGKPAIPWRPDVVAA
jgi:hypothetical protein